MFPTCVDTSVILDVIALASAIAELSQTCRRARTGLWCALQISWKAGYIPLGVMSKRAEVVAREKEALKEQQQLLAAQALAAHRPASGSSSVISAGPSMSSSSIGSSLPSGSLSNISLSDGAGSLSPFNMGLPSPFVPPADGNNNLAAMSKMGLP